jgi:hypothetical protein
MFPLVEDALLLALALGLAVLDELLDSVGAASVEAALGVPEAPSMAIGASALKD